MLFCTWAMPKGTLRHQAAGYPAPQSVVITHGARSWVEGEEPFLQRQVSLATSP